MPDSPVPPSRWGDSPPWWLNADAVEAQPPPSSVPSREGAPHKADGPRSTAPTPVLVEHEPASRAPARDGGAPRRRPWRRIVVVGAVGGLFAVAIAVAGGTLLLGGDDGGPEKRITLRPEAGGLRRNASDPEASVAYPFIVEAVRRGSLSRTRQTSAVYSGAASNVLFVGGTASIGDPIAFLDRAKPNTVLSFQHVGRGVCGTFAVLSAVHPYCAWATSDSYGFVASNLPAQNTTDLAKLATRLRADLER
ncbi:hypothetical protein [Actinomadura oligospora]|uniref:hypothetical protein n=1 Tax=Actinomadura oligospora TaxID=111804 RepID=UPI00047EC07E|nr:hypothetical protein [Actinomadura oligospora]